LDFASVIWTTLARTEVDVLLIAQVPLVNELVLGNKIYNCPFITPGKDCSKRHFGKMVKG